MKFETDKKEDVTELRKAFIKLLTNVDDANKSTDNTFTKSKYATLTDANNAAEKAIKDAGLALSADVTTDKDSGFVYVTNHLISANGEIIFETLGIPSSKRDAQGYGSAITYARRYSLCANLNISVEDDDGNEASNRDNNGYNNNSYNNNRGYNNNGGNYNNNRGNYNNRGNAQQSHNQSNPNLAKEVREAINYYANLTNSSNVNIIQEICRKGNAKTLEECPAPLLEQQLRAYGNLNNQKQANA